MRRRAVFAALLIALAAPAAGAPVLSLPLDCTLGETCYIQQFMDHDPSDAASDFMCGPRSYNTHKGTDFAVPTASDALENPIAVLAAARGTVLGLRDGMPDSWDGKIDADAIQGRDCGNGMVIDHGGGWHTQYCHLRMGSVRVKKGDVVETGTHLGDMGMSGRTEFAHLHLSVRKDGTPVDPFAPDGASCDAPITDTLWDELPLIQPGGILDLGFSDAVPEFAEVKMGVADKPLKRISPALVTYSFFFGGLQGDRVEMTLTGPGEFRVEQSYELTKNQAQFFRAMGKKRRSAPWPGGLYVADTKLIRDGKVIDAQRSSFEIAR